MASVQDRWFTERKDDYGRTVKVPTRLHGNAKIRRWRAHYRTPDGRQRNKTFARKVDADRFLTTVESSKLRARSWIHLARASRLARWPRSGPPRRSV